MRGRTDVKFAQNGTLLIKVGDRAVVPLPAQNALRPLGETEFLDVIRISGSKHSRGFPVRKLVERLICHKGKPFVHRAGDLACNQLDVVSVQFVRTTVEAWQQDQTRCSSRQSQELHIDRKSVV